MQRRDIIGFASTPVYLALRVHVSPPLVASRTLRVARHPPSCIQRTRALAWVAARHGTARYTCRAIKARARADTVDSRTSSVMTTRGNCRIARAGVVLSAEGPSSTEDIGIGGRLVRHLCVSREGSANGTLRRRVFNNHAAGVKARVTSSPDGFLQCGETSRIMYLRARICLAFKIATCLSTELINYSKIRCMFCIPGLRRVIHVSGSRYSRRSRRSREDNFVKVSYGRVSFNATDSNISITPVTIHLVPSRRVLINKAEGGRSVCAREAAPS